jgi:hypothetical protein
MDGSSFIKAEICRLAYLDGFSEGLNGMMAISFVLRNRVNAGWWGGDWVNVLSHHKDYSYRTEPYPDTIPDPRVFSFQTLLQEIDGIFSGQRVDDITVPVQPSFQPSAYPKALYYAKLDSISNPWFLESISRNTQQHSRVAQVGQLFFFS